jgi:chaperone BCS1
MGKFHPLFSKSDKCLLMVTSYQSAVTFSGFLNALDGVASGEERICFMTTNHIERLDPALIRPGRVDLSLFIGDATPNQAKRLYLQFYRDNLLEADKLCTLADDLASVFGRQWNLGKKISMAALQGHFIRSDAMEAVKNCVSLFTSL